MEVICKTITCEISVPDPDPLSLFGLLDPDASIKRQINLEKP
jgi:hypothetical protein